MVHMAAATGAGVATMLVHARHPMQSLCAYDALHARWPLCLQGRLRARGQSQPSAQALPVPGCVDGRTDDVGWAVQKASFGEASS